MKKQYIVILMATLMVFSALAVLSIFSTHIWGCGGGGCNPPCGPCQTCQGSTCVNKCSASLCQTCVDGSCQSTCNSCQTCVNGSCQPKCSSSLCQTCVNGTCYSTCNSSLCETCISGSCQSQCDTSLCQICVNGSCQPKCDPVSEICVNGECQCNPNLITYTYDAVGNRRTMTGPDCGATTSYTYDYLNRLTSVTDPDLKTINYQYDPSGNRTQLTDPEDKNTTYTYTANNQLLSVENTMDEGRRTQYQYDTLGNQIRVDEPNGTYSEYTYNPYRNWLTSVVNRNSGGTVLSSFDYIYDNVGNRLSVTELDDSVVNYTYDEIYQLTSETRTGSNAYSISYTYDNVGNRLQKTEVRGQTTETAYTHNDNNQLLTEIINAETTIVYAYDLNGNLLSKTDGSDTTLYSWDYNNRLITVHSPLNTVSYEYDGDGNRIQKTEVRNQTTETTNYINDVALPLVQVLMETNEAGEVQASYTYGNDLISINNEQLAINNYYHYDGLGSVRQLTDDTEAVVASYTYDAFGNLIASSGATTNAYGFTGEQQFNEPDNLVFLRARYYDSSIGRFISRDPILEPMRAKDGFVWLPLSFLDLPKKFNSYVYCVNNPINLVDPTGKESCSHCQDKCAKDAKTCYKKCLLEGNIIKVIFCRYGCYMTDRNCKTGCLDKPAL